MTDEGEWTAAPGAPTDLFVTSLAIYAAHALSGPIEGNPAILLEITANLGSPEGDTITLGRLVMPADGVRELIGNLNSALDALE